MATHLLGPTLKATICTPDLDRSVAAWQGSLYHRVHEQGTLSAERAAQLGARNMAGARHALLANELDEPWLELIENAGSGVLDPFIHKGWFSLEISVADVDQLRTTLDESLFKIIGEPANLDVSDDIRAMQVIGPAGEVLYLTEVKAPVPPFELPFARCPVDRLFIPVMLTDDRDATAAVYEQLSGYPGMRFDTKITVINRARGLEITQRHPVCVQQLAGLNLIEIDRLDRLQARPSADDDLPTGIVAITFAIESLPENLSGSIVYESAVGNQKRTSLRGYAGELIELVE